MGWFFSPQSRSDLIAELIATQETERVSAKVITPIAAADKALHFNPYTR